MDPKTILKAATKDDGSCIKELIGRIFTTRNLLHMAHWNTKSFAAHIATGELYDEVVDLLDEVVEVYQGKFGLIEGLSTYSSAVPTDICCHVKSEAEWVEGKRCEIARNVPSIENLVDGITAAMHKTVYKLENLR